MGAIARAGPDRNLELPPCPLFGCRGPRRWAILSCLPKFISRELGWKWNSRDTNHELAASIKDAGIRWQQHHSLNHNAGPSHSYSGWLSDPRVWIESKEMFVYHYWHCMERVGLLQERDPLVGC